MSGIEPIPKELRNLGGWDFFLLWAGAAVSLAEIWAGGLIVPLGLGLGLFAILLGHLIGNTPFAMGGLIGSRWGIPAMVSARPSFGVRGSYFAASLNVIQLIGWTAVMLIICGGAADAISNLLRILEPQTLDPSLRGDYHPLGPCGPPILEMDRAVLRRRPPDALSRHDSSSFWRIRLGKTFSRAETERLSLHGGNGSRNRHAHLLASPCFRLFTVCVKIEILLLGNLDRLLSNLVVDVSVGSGGFSGDAFP